MNESHSIPLNFYNLKSLSRIFFLENALTLTGEKMLFDTLKHVKIMQDVGFGRKQSEAMVTIWSSVVESQFVTKQDLKEALLKERLITNKLFEEIRIELESLKSQMESKFDNLENRITIKLGSIMVGVIAVSKVLEKFF